MTTQQALQLGHALTAWANGMILEVRDTGQEDNNWYPVFPENYEQLNVKEGKEWRAVKSSPLLASGALDRLRPIRGD
jgi:hypothetical protein